MKMVQINLLEYIKGIMSHTIAIPNLRGCLLKVGSSEESGQGAASYCIFLE
jgi:hypothetical protein